MCSITTGGPENIYTKDGMAQDTLEELIKHFNVTSPKMLLMETLPMFVCYGVNFAT